MESLQLSLAEAYAKLRFVNYVNLSGHTLVVIDFLHTFPDEVRLMWPAPLSVPKVLFFFTRYYILVHSIFTIRYETSVGLSAEKCRNVFILVFASSCFAVLWSEGILFFRVWAFGHRRRKIAMYLTMQYFTIHTPSFVFLILFLRTVRFPAPGGPDAPCLPPSAEYMYLGICFALALLSILTIMAIMVSIALRNYRNSENGLFGLFYRDGIFYFLCLSGLAVANSAVNFAAPVAYKMLLLEIQIVLHVVLSTRMILHLRMWASQDTSGEAMTADGMELTGVHYIRDIRIEHD
ncbi:hypothetical protein DFP72DRAFT_476440 [Ephemerocybe angulata]|uniref:DUF6533 domain-containing protein n=1 Tax=Ephemerocybe angulata TaxID=980116 RepID=A0A8H6M453_9AGAR|nr:hypothetical protein DFP72DRAFT_476440 [Tulosesus angulatus]